MKRFVFFFFVLFLNHSLWSQAARLDSFLRRQMKEFSIPGLAAAVVEDGKVVS
jgi:hypothetical protein